MLLGRPSHRLLLSFLFVLLFGGWFLYRHDLALPSSLRLDRTHTSTPVPPRPEGQAGNSTLGFQKILAVSPRPSWRTRGIEAAANLSQIDVEIPPQPPQNDRLVEAFANIGSDEGTARPEIGGAKAWIAHLDILKYVYQSNMETALILEDDADWDVAIRSQMQNLSTAVRNLTKTPNNDTTPYGRDWDVFWIGHCGASWHEDFETVVFDDVNVCPREYYKRSYSSALEDLRDGKRTVFKSDGPVCTSAYAVSHQGAHKVLQRTAGGQNIAFDLKLAAECQNGHLKCISVVPEVINQYVPPEEYKVTSEVQVGNGKPPPPPDKDFEFKMGTVDNIVHSARCQALWNEDCQQF